MAHLQCCPGDIQVLAGPRVYASSSCHGMRKGCRVVAEGEVGPGPSQAWGAIVGGDEDRQVQVDLLAGCLDPAAVGGLLGWLLRAGAGLGLFSQPLEGLQSVAGAQVRGQLGAAGGGSAREAKQNAQHRLCVGCVGRHAVLIEGLEQQHSQLGAAAVLQASESAHERLLAVSRACAWVAREPAHVTECTDS